MSSREIDELRRQLAELRFEFEALRLEVSELRRASGGTAYPSAASPAASVPTPASDSVVAPSDKEARAELARQIGRFLRSAYEGSPFGTSGRDRLSLRSRLYIALADYHGSKFRAPRLYREFSQVAALCKRGPSLGQSIFVGFATEWEARLALEEGRFDWPAEASYGA